MTISQQEIFELEESQYYFEAFTETFLKKGILGVLILKVEFWNLRSKNL